MEKLSSEAVIQKAMESSPAGIIISNSMGVIIYCNPKIEEIFGYEKGELFNKTIETLVPENLREKHVKLRTNYMKAPYSRAMGAKTELQGQHKNGSLLHVEIGLNPVVINNETYIVSSLIDISKNIESIENLRKSNEQLATVNQELENFSYIATSFLTTPLRKLRSFADALLNNLEISLDSETQLFLGNIQQETTKMEKLLKRLYEFSKLTTTSENSSEVNLNNTISQVLKSLDSKIKSLNAKIDIENNASITGVPNLIYILFENLIKNALEAHDKDRPIHIKIRLLKSNKQTRIEIEDNGIGFDMKFHDVIFDLFRKFSEKSHSEFGIGLAICKKIVLHAGGKIYASSVLGQGSTFTVEIPNETNHLTSLNSPQKCPFKH